MISARVAEIRGLAVDGLVSGDADRTADQPETARRHDRAGRF
jgi:hypothetical protein